MTFLSYAQNFEDVLLWRALRDVGQGFYIDVGAWHPDEDSVTRAFYDRGWHGIDIEPVGEYHQRLAAARPRDICLNVAVGAHAGQATLHAIFGTGLSTLYPALAERAAGAGFGVTTHSVPQRTLAGICAEHAPGDIHFLKIDVEGAEQAVLEGADFAVRRPWIVLLEAVAPLDRAPTHAGWEPILLHAGYRFVWFDGLNRFYVAAEHHTRLAPHFTTPPNVFDGFVRAADSQWARQIGAAEQQVRDLAERAHVAEARALAAEQRASIANFQRIEAVSVRLAEHTARLDAEQRAAASAAWLEAVRTSTSWRLLGPLRRALRLIRRNRPAAPATLALGGHAPGGQAPGRHAPAGRGARPPAPAEPLPEPWPATAASRPAGAKPRTVHQFHSGSATNDAVTNALFLVRGILRSLGYASEIYVQHRDSALAQECRLLDELPTHADYVLIVHHSIGYDACPAIAALPARKLLMYHNITPPALLGSHPRVQSNAALGRLQLAAWRGRVEAALAVSEYNAIELRALGFDPVRVCTLLFDTQALLADAARRPPTRGGTTFTILFVGRIAQSKAQDALVDAFAAFRAHHPGPARLVLIGRTADDHDPFLHHLLARVQASGLQADILLTGLLPDAERDAWYAAADLYVSLSQHEGFGVPLVEAMAHGVPVLAWPSGAIPYTLGDTGALLDSRDPAAVGARIAALAQDPAQRAAIAAGQLGGLDRFALDRQVAVLQQALLLAGAAPPASAAEIASLRRNLRFTIAGHLDGSYSLAAVNRRLALVLEQAAPGSVRLEQIEAGAAVRDLAHVPPAQRAAIAALAARPGFATGPEIVISQHYPVQVPAHAGDALLAFFFWEESAIPDATIARLNQHFAGVLAPSAFVAKTLVDNGLSVPVRIVGLAPDLAVFAAIERAVTASPPFTFLHVSSCFARKGVEVLLAGYAAAFRRTDPVRLVIKGFANPHNDAAALVAALRDRDPDAAPIEVIDSDLDPDALAALYAGADAMVLPTRGEGFNLPAAEALAAGLPLIVTGFGGHLDFCHPDNARLLDYRFARSASHLAAGVSVWAEPDVAALTQALRDIRQNHPAALARAQAARRHIPAGAGAGAWPARVRETALQLLVRPPDPALRIAFITSWGVRCGIAEYARQLIEALPHSDRLGEIFVLADDRLPADAAPHPRVTTRIAWRLHDAASFGRLHTAIAAADPHAVVIQHQPGLLSWPQLAELLSAPTLAGRIVTVTLHNTRHLATIAPDARAPVVAALGNVSRVIVHTIADLNTMRTHGLVDNVVLLPQGIAPARADHAAADPTPAPRDLPPHAAPVLGCTGFFLPGKGIPQLIEAAAGLRARWPGLRLRLVNADYGHPDSAAEIAAARAVAARTGMAGAIEWHTEFLPAEQSRALLAGCDLIALPYQASLEASSAALRTALGAGVPILTTPLALFDEAGEAVLRASGTDLAALQAALAEALADPAARRQALAAARQWTQDLAWPRIAARLLGMLAGLHGSDADLRAWRRLRAQAAAPSGAGGSDTAEGQPPVTRSRP